VNRFFAGRIRNWKSGSEPETGDSSWENMFRGQRMDYGSGL